MQFYRPEKNVSEYDVIAQFEAETQPPQEVVTILKQKCYDCHSNQTEYPWYAEVAPISIWIDGHVEEGKEHFNVSEWATYSLKKKDHKLEELIEEVEENEYFKDKRIQVSIFMSPINVHVTRYAASGVIKYSKYHPGKYLVAWHPKSSEKNERTTVVINTPKFGDILYRQIAGAVARRIVNYAEVGEHVQQGEDAGFIKFGSRVDLLLPLDSVVTVKLNQKVVGAKTCIATLAENEEGIFT